MNAVATMLREFDAATEEYNAKKQAVTEQLRPQFHTIFKDYLEAHPCIATLEATAFTPYFMDGGVCEYSVNELGATLVDVEVDYAAEFFGSYNDVFEKALAYLKDGTIPPKNSWNKQADEDYAANWPAEHQYDLDLGVELLEQIVAAKNAGQELVRTFASIPEDVIKNLFGDHVRIIIDRDGVTTEEYDHD